MLEMVHKEHGKLPWATLFQPAITLAEGGFKVSARLNTLATADAHFKKDPMAAAYFFKPDSEAHDMGFHLRNPELAAVPRRIATEGSKALHEGEIAQTIVDKAQKHTTNPDKLSMADLAGYQPKQHEPLCHDYQVASKNYRMCDFPLPSSGAIAIAQILDILRNTDAAAMPLEDGLPTADWLHLYTDASRLAFADRGQYVADPDFVQPPAGSWASLIAPAYLAERAKLIGTQSLKLAQPAGQAPWPPATRPCQTSPSTAPDTSASSMPSAMQWQ